METDTVIFSEGKNEVTEQLSIQKNSFSENGDAIEEIISKKPPFVVLWGTGFFFLFLVFISIICWYIQYPDIVTAGARLNSINAPKQVITRIDGKLIKITIKENEKVDKGQILGYMESVANLYTVTRLHSQMDSIISLIEQNRTNEIIKYFPQDISVTDDNKMESLGEIQPSYQTFVQAFIMFRDFLKSGVYLLKKKMLLTDMENLKRLNSILLSQKALIEQDISLSNETFKGNESLASDKVISPLDYRNEKSKLINKQLSLPQIKASIVSYESLQNEKRKEIVELENQIIVQKNTFFQASLTMMSQIQAWEYKYLLKAPVSGSVSFAGFFQENQELKAAQLLFYIQPNNTSYFIEMSIPQYNLGKVKPGQRVLLKFHAYPFEQYGSVVGKVEYISSTATDSGYIAKVILPNGLMTTYNKPLQYRNGLAAQADIVTENVRLLQRFYYNIVRQVKR